MSETASNVVTYTPLIGGDGESRWIRLEQVQATLPGPPVAVAAELVDLLFDIEPCDDGMGGGGEEAGEMPDEERVEEALSLLLERNGQCRQGYWLAAVNVYRTHEQPGYELRSETATVETVEPKRESYRQVVDVSGPLIALEMPYAGGLTGIPNGVNWTVRGGTVNLDRPVHERLVLRYDTWYEHVTLRVPTKRTDDGEEYEAAAVVAFWGDMAAECQLDPPEPEDEEDRQAKRDLCNGPKPDEPEPGDCWKTIGHYMMCECSRKRVNEWEEQASAPCDGFSAGAYVGHEEHFDGYAGGDGCDGYEPELRTPEFYKKRCCKPLPFSTSRLPGCRRYYAQYRGGHAIENGPEHWKNIYGEDVRLVAVLPESGVCGDLITDWNIPNKNCCAEAEPLTPDPDNPEEIEPGQTYWIGVEGGLPGYAEGEMIWQASGGLEFADNGETTLKTPHGTKGVRVRARSNICPEPALHVDDGCSSLTMTFRGDEGEGPRLSETDMEVNPGVMFSLSVSGGVPGYMWQASDGLTTLGWSPDGATAYFRAGAADEWCVATVTVVDQCGRSASCTVRNGATGSWRQLAENEYDPCNPPGAPFPPMSGQQCYSNQQNVLNGGYRANISSQGFTSTGCGDDGLWCPAGTVLTVGYGACVQSDCERGRNTWMGNGCCKSRLSGSTTVTAQRVVRLWKWVCGDA